jgi:hypothetical protein
LLAFADVVPGPDDGMLTRTREAIRSAVGDAGLSDAGAVVGGFEPTRPEFRWRRKRSS